MLHIYCLYSSWFSSLLTVNKIIKGKRYCPCFVVEGKTEEDRKKSNNRICPCEPALQKEIPETGRCYCGIFCTENYVKNYQKVESDIIKNQPLLNSKLLSFWNFLIIAFCKEGVPFPGT